LSYNSAVVFLVINGNIIRFQENASGKMIFFPEKNSFL